MGIGATQRECCKSADEKRCGLKECGDNETGEKANYLNNCSKLVLSMPACLPISFQLQIPLKNRH